MATKANSVKISTFKNSFDTNCTKETTIDDFLNSVLEGQSQDLVLAVRNCKDQKQRSELKRKLPSVTISGSFSERKDNALRAHSGFIGIDIDGLNDQVEPVKELLSKDPYVYAAFVSVSGSGLCVIFKIEGERHADAFTGLSAYLYANYQLIVDPTGSNLSRLRYTSYDPNLYSTNSPLTFKKYLPKEKPRKIQKVVFVKSEFDNIINEFIIRHINICEDYRDWVIVGYALISEFGSNGEHYYHSLSSVSSKYSYEDCSKMYKALLKNNAENKANRATIATIYYLAKQNNIETYSKFTQEVIKSTTTLKKNGLDAKSIAKNIEEFEGIDSSETIDIINQAIDNDVEITDSESIVDQVERWIQYNTKLKRNEVTRKIENDGVFLDKIGFNSLFIECKKTIEKIDFNLFERIIISDKTTNYNPFYEWFAAYNGRSTTGHIEKLISTIETPNKEFSATFIRKWIVGVIASMHYEHSPLVLILAGEKQGTGKTEWFRRLLPKELKTYYGESKLDAGKDDHILMCQKIIIMDDEMGGKNKKESKTLKDLTSKAVFSLREPYGSSNIDLPRLAVLCGTTNDYNVLNDPTGNRRLIPIEVLNINQKLYNVIDKIDLWLEAYNLYKDGFDWQLTRDDIDFLNKNTAKMETYSLEYELLQRYFIIPENSITGEHLSASEIKVFLDTTTRQNTNLNRIGQELKNIGFEQDIKWINGKTKRVYYVQKTDYQYNQKNDPLPF